MDGGPIREADDEPSDGWGALLSEPLGLPPVDEAAGVAAAEPIRNTSEEAIREDEAFKSEQYEYLSYFAPGEIGLNDLFCESNLDVLP